ncbi:MAG: helix-turn-helix domain-containing protein [Bacteroidales bacterium]
MPLPRTLPILPARFLSVMLILLFSCNSPFTAEHQNKQERVRYENLIAKARLYAARNSDSCLLYTDTALKQALSLKIEDTVLMNIYKIRADFFSTARQYDSSLSNEAKAVAIAKSIPDSAVIASGYQHIGQVYLKLQNIGLSEQNLAFSLNLYNRLGMEYESAVVRIKMGELLTLKGEYEQSQKYLMDVYKWLDQNGHTENISTVCIDIGNNFAAIGSLHEAIEYYRMASQYALNQKEYYNSASALNNVGISFRYINPDSALFYYQKALFVLKEVGKNDLEIIIRYNMANVFVKKNDYINAAAFYDSVLFICTERKIPDGVARAYSSKAMLAEKDGSIPKSVNYLHKAISIADSIGNNDLKLALMDQLYQVLRDNGNLIASSAMSDKIMALKDSVMNIEKQIAIHGLEQKYQAEKKELENTKLRQYMAYQDEILLFRLMLIIVLIAGLLGSGVFSYFYYKQTKQKINSYRILFKKYEEEKQKQSVTLSGFPHLQRISSTKDETPTESEVLIQNLIYYFEHEQPFMNHNLKAEEVALKLKISHRSLNNALKEKYDCTFNTYLNKYRVEYVKMMFEDMKYRSIKTEVIAKDAGFGSVRSFYRAFEHTTGMMPSYFRRFIEEKQGKSIA